MHVSHCFSAALTASLLFLVSPAGAALAPSSGTTSFILDGNRIYARVNFVRRDGSTLPGLAYVDSGAPRMSLNQGLLDALGPDNIHPLTMRIGAFPISIDPALVDVSRDQPRRLGGLLVEATLPASVLSKFEVVVDYRRKRLTVAMSGTVRACGIGTPFVINSQTGLLAVDAAINGRTYPVTVDLGSAWTWFRQSEINSWLRTNPRWARAAGAIGASNMMMIGDLEATGILARVPQIRIGAVQLKNVDVLGPGPTKAFPTDLFAWYSAKNAVPVLGWIGGNVLKEFRLTIDYPHRLLYWQREAPPDSGELDQVGLTLRRVGPDYVIAGVAARDGHPTVAGVRTDDVLVAVDGRSLSNASLGTVFVALHGRPGETRMLLIRRNNQRLTIAAKVTAF